MGDDSDDDDGYADDGDAIDAQPRFAKCALAMSPRIAVAMPTFGRRFRYMLILLIAVNSVIAMRISIIIGIARDIAFMIISIIIDEFCNVTWCHGNWMP